MLKIFTLAAAGLLAVTSFSTQAQITHIRQDGVLSADELTGYPAYHLLGTFTNPRGFGDYGLLSLYVSVSNTRINLFVGGTVESNGNAFQLFFKFPATAGVPLATALPGATGSNTSFEKMTAKLDMPANAALALRYSKDQQSYVVEQAALTSATSETAQQLMALEPHFDTAGLFYFNTDVAHNNLVPTFSFPIIAYRPTADGKVTSNPGYRASSSDPQYGGVGTYGWELEFDRYDSDATLIQRWLLFLLQNSGDGGYLSSDYLPQATLAPTANFGNLGDASKVDFATIGGIQAYNLLGDQLLATRAGTAAVGLGVYPNPVAGTATVSYRVPLAGAPVQVELLDLLGRRLRLLDSGVKTAGSHSAPLNAGTEVAGTYLVRVQVGDDVATSRVVLR